jgi:hypothetical protein
MLGDRSAFRRTSREQPNDDARSPASPFSSNEWRGSLAAAALLHQAVPGKRKFADLEATSSDQGADVTHPPGRIRRVTAGARPASLDLIAAARNGCLMNWKGLSFRASIMWSYRRFFSENQQKEICHHLYLALLLSLLFMTAATSAS